jgi:hypothetical protein
MEDDEIVKEVRRAREYLVREAGGDLDSLVAWLKRCEGEERRELVPGPDEGCTDQVPTVTHPAS